MSDAIACFRIARGTEMSPPDRDLVRRYNTCVVAHTAGVFDDVQWLTIQQGFTGFTTDPQGKKICPDIVTLLRPFAVQIGVRIEILRPHRMARIIHTKPYQEAIHA